jgi:hypothetical protein
MNIRKPPERPYRGFDRIVIDIAYDSLDRLLMELKDKNIDTKYVTFEIEYDERLKAVANVPELSDEEFAKLEIKYKKELDSYNKWYAKNAKTIKAEEKAIKDKEKLVFLKKHKIEIDAKIRRLSKKV